jgi:hypothetical protein
MQNGYADVGLHEKQAPRLDRFFAMIADITLAGVCYARDDIRAT